MFSWCPPTQLVTRTFDVGEWESTLNGAPQTYTQKHSCARTDVCKMTPTVRANGQRQDEHQLNPVFLVKSFLR